MGTYALYILMALMSTPTCKNFFTIIIIDDRQFSMFPGKDIWRPRLSLFFRVFCEMK